MTPVKGTNKTICTWPGLGLTGSTPGARPGVVSTGKHLVTRSHHLQHRWWGSGAMQCQAAGFVMDSLR